MARRETYYIPLGLSIDTQTAPHLLDKGQTPFAKNCSFNKRGVIQKRYGVTLMAHTFADTILSYYQAESDRALVCCANGHVYEYDYANSPTSLGSGFDAAAQWYFVKHYDSNVGAVTIATNGYDAVQKYASTATPKMSELIGPTGIRGRFPASFYGSLYLASTKEWSGSAWTTNAYRVAWSAADDATTWNALDFQDRPEDGTAITALCRFGDNLILGKEDQIWNIAPVSNFTRITSKRGVTSPNSLASTDDVYFNFTGKIYSLSGDAWLSYPIQNIMQSSSFYEGRVWDDRYTDQVIFSLGSMLYIYDKSLKLWYVHEFPEEISVMGEYPPSQKKLDSWTGYLSEHTALLIEEDVLRSMMYRYNSTRLAVLDTNYNDNGAAITMEYATRWESCDAPDNYKRFFKITIQGTPGSTFTVLYDSANNPGTISYATLGTCTIDSNGWGSLDCDILSKWIIIKLQESSTNACSIEQIKLEYTLREGR